MKLKNAWNHFKKICVHKYWVFYYCKKAGITWRGIKHDMSKFSPIEFLESVEYYQGDSSPIDACKKANGVSYAWMHHKGRNDHHYEYWVDNLDKGGQPIKMPYEPAVEMLCDFLGAGRAYSGKNFTYTGELKWFINKINTNPAMHPDTIKFIFCCLDGLSYAEKHCFANSKNKESEILNRDFTSRILRANYEFSKNYENFTRDKMIVERRIGMTE